MTMVNSGLKGLNANSCNSNFNPNEFANLYCGQFSRIHGNIGFNITTEAIIEAHIITLGTKCVFKTLYLHNFTPKIGQT